MLYYFGFQCNFHLEKASECHIALIFVKVVISCVKLMVYWDSHSKITSSFCPMWSQCVSRMNTNSFFRWRNHAMAAHGLSIYVKIHVLMLVLIFFISSLAIYDHAQAHDMVGCQPKTYWKLLCYDDFGCFLSVYQINATNHFVYT